MGRRDVMMEEEEERDIGQVLTMGEEEEEEGSVEGGRGISRWRGRGIRKDLVGSLLVAGEFFFSSFWWRF